MQHQKATGKGGTEFALAYAEQLQRVLPDTLAFEFEQRDDAGSAAEANMKQAKLKWVADAYNAGLQAGAPLISRDEARQLLADEQLIPNEWTLTPDESTSTDTEADANAEQMLDTVPVRRAIAQFPYEPIVRVNWPSRKMQVLWDPLRRKRTFAKPVIKCEIKHQDEERPRHYSEGRQYESYLKSEFDEAMSEFREALQSKETPAATIPHEMTLNLTGLLPQQQPQPLTIQLSPMTIENRMPATPAPIINIDRTPVQVHVEPTPVNIQQATAPIVRFTAPAINVNVEPTPITVNVEPTPVNVNVPEQPVTLTLDGTTSVVSRDRQGRIIQIQSQPDAQVNKD